MDPLGKGPAPEHPPGADFSLPLSVDAPLTSPAQSHSSMESVDSEEENMPPLEVMPEMPYPGLTAVKEEDEAETPFLVAVPLGASPINVEDDHAAVATWPCQQCVAMFIF